MPISPNCARNDLEERLRLVDENRLRAVNIATGAVVLALVASLDSDLGWISMLYIVAGIQVNAYVDETTVATAPESVVGTVHEEAVVALEL